MCSSCASPLTPGKGLCPSCGSYTRPAPAALLAPDPLVTYAPPPAAALPFSSPAPSPVRPSRVHPSRLLALVAFLLSLGFPLLYPALLALPLAVTALVKVRSDLSSTRKATKILAILALVVSGVYLLLLFVVFAFLALFLAALSAH